MTNKHIKTLNEINPERIKIDTTIENVSKGNYLSVYDEDYVVSESFKYKEVNWEDFSEEKDFDTLVELELTSLETDDKIYIGWIAGRFSELWHSIEIPLANIKYQDSNEKVTFKDLEFITEEEEGTVNFSLPGSMDETKGVNYEYSDEDTLSFILISDTSSPETDKNLYKGRFYGFFSSENQKALTFEVYDLDTTNPEIEAFIEKELLSDDIKIWNI